MTMSDHGRWILETMTGQRVDIAFGDSRVAWRAARQHADARGGRIAVIDLHQDRRVEGYASPGETPEPDPPPKYSGVDIEPTEMTADKGCRASVAVTGAHSGAELTADEADAFLAFHRTGRIVDRSCPIEDVTVHATQDQYYRWRTKPRPGTSHE